jgi:hypothetical protein
MNKMQNSHFQYENFDFVPETQQTKKKKKKGKATLEISSLKFQFDLVDNLQSMNV